MSESNNHGLKQRFSECPTTNSICTSSANVDNRRKKLPPLASFCSDIWTVGTAWCKQHEIMDLSCFFLTLEAAASVNDVRDESKNQY